jgi:DNA primase
MVTDVYTEAQIDAILREIGVSMISETGNDFTCLCPFHNNRFSPALSVSKHAGTYICFSPECGVRGNLSGLVSKLTGRDSYEAARFIAKYAAQSDDQFLKELSEALEVRPEFNEFDQTVLDRLRAQMWQLPEGREYLHGRGYIDDTIEHFDLGLSVKENMVIVPVHSPDGLPIGLVGRSIKGKDFKNSRRLQKSKTLYNLHRAKRSGGTLIVSEASFDTHKVFQAGYGDAGVAILGGTLSKEQVYLLNRYATRIIIATDFDDKEAHKIKGFCRRCDPAPCVGHNPGRDLGMDIAQKLGGKEILWGAYEPGVSVFPPGKKDLSDMSDTETATFIENAMSNYSYNEWLPY